MQASHQMPSLEDASPDYDARLEEGRSTSSSGASGAKDGTHSDLAHGMEFSGRTVDTMNVANTDSVGLQETINMRSTRTVSQDRSVAKPSDTVQKPDTDAHIAQATSSFKPPSVSKAENVEEVDQAIAPPVETNLAKSDDENGDKSLVRSKSIQSSAQPNQSSELPLRQTVQEAVLDPSRPDFGREQSEPLNRRQSETEEHIELGSENLGEAMKNIEARQASVSSEIDSASEDDSNEGFQIRQFPAKAGGRPSPANSAKLLAPGNFSLMSAQKTSTPFGDQDNREILKASASSAVHEELESKFLEPKSAREGETGQLASDTTRENSKLPLRKKFSGRRTLPGSRRSEPISTPLQSSTIFRADQNTAETSGRQDDSALFEASRDPSDKAEQSKAQSIASGYTLPVHANKSRYTLRKSGRYNAQTHNIMMEVRVPNTNFSLLDCYEML